MEVALIIYMCSAIQNTCLDPYVWPETFYDNYGCMIQGYKESEKKQQKQGEKMSTNMTYTLNLTAKNIR